jgi:DNA-binding NarL/FixJ family response regulator
MCGAASEMGEEIGTNSIRLILLDNHALFRASLARFLALEHGFEVVGECGSPAEALGILRDSTVDVVLLDFYLGPEQGNDFIPAARKAGYQGRFLIVTGAADPRNVAVALKLGAAGIFLKSDAADRLVQAIRLVADGGVWVDQKMIQLLADELVEDRRHVDSPRSDTLLNDGERKVLLGILGGLTNKKIGGNIGLSESSVKAIVQRLFAKAGVRTRSQLVRVALEGSLAAAGRRTDSVSLSVAEQSHG